MTTYMLIGLAFYLGSAFNYPVEKWVKAGFDNAFLSATAALFIWPLLMILVARRFVLDLIDYNEGRRND